MPGAETPGCSCSIGICDEKHALDAGQCSDTDLNVDKLEGSGGIGFPKVDAPSKPIVVVGTRAEGNTADQIGRDGPVAAVISKDERGGEPVQSVDLRPWVRLCRRLFRSCISLRQLPRLSQDTLVLQEAASLLGAGSMLRANAFDGDKKRFEIELAHHILHQSYHRLLMVHRCGTFHNEASATVWRAAVNGELTCVDAHARSGKLNFLSERAAAAPSSRAVERSLSSQSPPWRGRAGCSMS